MADQQLTNLLAEMVRTNARRGPLPNFNQVAGLSQSILSGVPVQNPYQANPQNNQADPNGPSVINRILDIMSRPLYAVLNPIKHNVEEARNLDVQDALVNAYSNLINPTKLLPQMWAGLSGKEKTTGRDIIDATGALEDAPGAAKFAIGLGTDIIADPLTYVGGLGLVSKFGKGAKASVNALRGVEEGTARTAQNLTEEISRRAAAKANTLDETITLPVSNKPTPAFGPKPPTYRGAPGLPDPNLNQMPFIEPAEQIGKLTENEFGKLKSLDPELQSELDKLKVLDPKLVPKHIQEDLAGKELDKLKALDPKLETPQKLALPAPPHTKALMDIKALNEQIAAAKSPVAKNLLRIQVNKLKAGVKPADILSEARVAPVEFPALTINNRWIEAAQNAAREFLKTNRLKNINHVGQTNLYNKIIHAASKVRKDRRSFHVLQMLRAAEDVVLEQGRHLVDAEGISVRLSDLANMMGGPRALNSRLVDDFRKARPSQQLEFLKSATTPQVASEILDPVIATGKELVPFVKQLPPSQTVRVSTDISDALRRLAEAAGASSREAKTAKAFIDDLFDPVRDKLYSSIHREARNLVRQSADGILNPRSMYKISEDVYESLGTKSKVLGRQLEQHKVVEGIMTKFATWWGAKDLKPFSREYIDTARNVAAAFSETLKPLVARSTPSQRKVAWSVASGKISAGSSTEQELANQFKYIVERLMGTHGITNNAEAVVLRSGTLMKELNDELPKALQFIGKKGVDDLGRAYDYTKGNWMHSWKEWKPQEPAEALYQLTRAMQMVTRKNAMWDDAVARWGMPVKGAEFQHEVKNIPRLKGTYFPKQIADQLDNLQSQLTRDVFRTPHKAIELFDKVQRMWKTGVTIYSPSHHIRNLNGDIFLAALDGVVSPRPYAIATKVLHAFPTRYKDLESVFNIMDPNLREHALRSRPGNVVLTTRKGEKVTAEQLYQAAESQGLFVRAMHAEDLVGDAAPAFGTFGSKFKPFGGKVYGAATRATELRDHWVRLAHFADILGKSKQPLRVAIEQAGRRVKKFHPDGMDLTGFEQNVLRRIIPFYSWMRKATPLVIEGALMRPHITLAFPKTMANLQLATGIESQGPGDPFPMDQMFPDWLKEKGIGPILQPGSGLGRDETWRGEAPGYTIINPTNPFIDQISQIGSPGKTLLSSLSPAARIPLELLTGRTSLGIPLESVEGGVPGHLAQQIPAVGIGARITGMTRDNEPFNPEQLINWLTSLGVTGTGPYEPQAQTEIRQLLAEMAKQNRGDYR